MRVLGEALWVEEGLQVLEVGRVRAEQQGGVLDRVTTACKVHNYSFFKRNFGGLAYKGQPNESHLLNWDGKLLLFALLGFQKICRRV